LFARIGDSSFVLAAGARNAHESVVELSAAQIGAELFDHMRRQAFAIGFALGDEGLEVIGDRLIEQGRFGATARVAFYCKGFCLHGEASNGRGSWLPMAWRVRL